jgi:hypothetical protein
MMSNVRLRWLEEGTRYFPEDLFIVDWSQCLELIELFSDGATEGAHDVVDAVEGLSCYDVSHTFCDFRQRIWVQRRCYVLVERQQLSDIVDEVLERLETNWSSFIPSCNLDRNV